LKVYSKKDCAYRAVFFILLFSVTKQVNAQGISILFKLKVIIYDAKIQIQLS